MKETRVLTEDELDEIQRCWNWAQPQGPYQCVDINELARLSDDIPSLICTINEMHRKVKTLTESHETLRENMHQAFAYMAQCPDCGWLLPEHREGCELYKAMYRGEADAE